ncbi:MAG: ABC transporter ATP-binding protein [Lachnospiraceae bacterium]|nr:ABC transporter ATP-binding protein [Lachnospiraceae bacterium]
MLKKLNYIFDKKQKIELIWTLFIITVGAFLELIGISIIYPFIDMTMSTDWNADGSLYHQIAVLFHIDTREHFLVFLAIVIIAIYVLKSAFMIYMFWQQYRYTYNNQQRIAGRLLSTYMKQPYSFFVNNNSAFLFKSISMDIPQFFVVVQSALQFCSHMILALILCIYLIWTDWMLTIAAFAVILLVVCIFGGYFKKYTTSYGQMAQSSSAQMHKWLQQAFEGIKEIKILGRENVFQHHFLSYYLEYVNVQKKYMMFNQVPRLILEACCVMVIILVVVYKITNINGMEEYLATLAVFAVALFRMFPKISDANACFNTILYYKPSLNLVYENLKRADTDFTQVNNCGKTREISFDKNIVCKNLIFFYPDNKDKIILNNINIEIPCGKTVALTGASGEGKTTLADIILGILKPVQGDVMIDEKYSIQEYSGAWAEKIGYIPQNIFILDDTIENNILFGNENNDSEQMRNAVEMAGLKEFIDSLPNGLQTQVGERGMKVSGGQKQRIGIARALYNNPDFLVMDEATSALDTDTEKTIIETIENLKGKKTLLIIAHRISTIVNCDDIYRLKDGKIEKVRREDLYAE